MEYGTFIYGTGIKYGSASSLESVFPENGISDGGDDFVITGEGFFNKGGDDDFTDILLDSVKWTDISTGSGSVQTGSNHLVLNTNSTSGQIAGIQSNTSYGNFQAEVLISIPISSNPTGDIKCFVYDLYVNSTTKASIEIIKNSDGEYSLKTYTMNGGRITSERVTNWGRGNYTLKILRFGTKVYFITNGSVIFSAINFRSDPASVRLYCDNSSDNFIKELGEKLRLLWMKI